MRPGLPMSLRLAGWLALGGGSTLVGRIVYEETVLSWTSGPQMVGYSLAHLFPSIALTGLLFLLSSVVVLLIGLGYAASRKGMIRLLDWILLSLLTCVVGAICVPYGSWQALMVRLLGPGRHGPALLTYFAATRDYPAVKALIDNGVPVTSRDYVPVHLSFARRLEMRGETYGAIDEYREVLDRAPDDVEAYMGLGSGLEKTHDYKSALEAYHTGCLQLGGMACCAAAEKLERKVPR